MMADTNFRASLSQIRVGNVSGSQTHEAAKGNYKILLGFADNYYV